MKRIHPAALGALLGAVAAAAAPPPPRVEERATSRRPEPPRPDGIRFVRFEPSMKKEIRRQLQAELGRKLSGRQFRKMRKKLAREHKE